jgi:hypothetical protein
MKNKCNFKVSGNQDNQNRFSNPIRKEVNMSKKAVLRIVLSAGLIAVVLLAVQVFTTESASAPTALDPATEERLAGSDNIFLHPPVPLPANYYTGSDWIERHPVPTISVSCYTGTDWIDRRPCQPTP